MWEKELIENVILSEAKNDIPIMTFPIPVGYLGWRGT